MYYLLNNHIKKKIETSQSCLVNGTKFSESSIASSSAFQHRPCRHIWWKIKPPVSTIASNLMVKFTPPIDSKSAAMAYATEESIHPEAKSNINQSRVLVLTILGIISNRGWDICSLYKTETLIHIYIINKPLIFCVH